MLGILKNFFTVLLSSMLLTIQNVYCQVIKNARFNLLLFIYILMNTLTTFHNYPSSVKLDRFAWSWNTVNDLSNKVCVPNNTEDLI